MKHDILSFIDSDTLREMLRGKELAPAIECILIAQSRKQPMTKKLEALKERADTYSDAEFQTGVYNLRDCDGFAWALKKYIAIMQETMQSVNSTEKGYTFQVCSDYERYSNIYSSFSDAVNYLRTEFSDDDSFAVIRRRIDDFAEPPITFLLNENYEIVSVRRYEDDEWNIEEAFCELSDDYNIGDIIRYQDDYFVIASVSHADCHTRWLKNADYGDMSLYCFGYYPDKLHSCGGSYAHYHVPILQAEMAKAEEMPEKMKPLTALSLLLKGEMKITDFLESYSNGALEDLMNYYGKKAK